MAASRIPNTLYKRVNLLPTRDDVIMCKVETGTGRKKEEGEITKMKRKKKEEDKFIHDMAPLVCVFDGTLQYLWTSLKPTS